ncbi:PDZ and LIM domain protein 7 [Liparis tanakae]|uniref:PDZ and LIM domain protein 7 n=1 Tax=Liparis tanakae TaxID=230148 RepID=A0A4Z2EVQ0_9TELE|nr:PDZ and LIM domain protein 7 [Liparis tanakae]
MIAFKAGGEQKASSAEGRATGRGPSPPHGDAVAWQQQEELHDSLAPASVQPKYSFAPSSTINKMARPFSAAGGNPAVKPVAYSPKANRGAPPHNG